MMMMITATTVTICIPVDLFIGKEKPLKVGQIKKVNLNKNTTYRR